jgi:DNA-binding MarR family transcriptional regulator
VLALASSLRGGTSRTPLPRDSADQLTARQQAALDLIAARHPRPITSAQLATELQLAPGALNVALRSLQRRQLIAVVPATARRRGGWTLWPSP